MTSRTRSPMATPQPVLGLPLRRQRQEPSAEAATYARCVQAVTQMRQQQASGTDPTHGATHFNFRRNASRAAFYNFAIQTLVGPLTNSYPTADLPATGIHANAYGN